MLDAEGHIKARTKESWDSFVQQDENNLHFVFVQYFERNPSRVKLQTRRLALKVATNISSMM